MVRTRAKKIVLSKGKLTIRRARHADAERLAELSGQLGYPVEPAELAKRLRKIKPAAQNAVLVAESAQRGVIGWLHVSAQALLEVGPRAEVNALIVGDEERSRGAGAALLRAAEQWSRNHGCETMSVRSNVLRERAHQFYLRNGYEHYKTQKAFRKALR